MHSVSSKSAKTLQTHTSLPDFNAIHDGYSKAVCRGRHPISFPKKSELWHHFHASKERVERISKGHPFWEVIRDQDGRYVGDEKAQEDESGKLKFNIQPNGRGAVQLRTINGIQVDVKSEIPIHYGMLFVVMNLMEEVLCVNKWDEVKCKPIHLIEPTDKICFKLIDLADPSNPAVLKYGAPLWLQCLDSVVESEISWQTGHILGAKVWNTYISTDAFFLSSPHPFPDIPFNVKIFGPPQGVTMQMDLNWGLNNAKGSKDVTGKSASSGEGVAVQLPTINALKRSAAAVPSPVGMGSSSSSPALSKRPYSASEEESKSARTDDDDEASDDASVDSSNGAGAGGRGRRKASKADAKQTKGKQVDAEIVGDCELVRIVGRAVEHGTISEMANVVSGGGKDEKTLRYHSKQAWHLGQWTIRSGEQKRRKNTIVKTHAPIYLEQDLYCLATSHGSGFRPFPKNSFEFQKREQNFPRLRFAGQTGDDYHRPSTFDSMNRIMGLVNTTGSADVSQSELPVPPNDTGEFGCLRRVALRGPPYKSLLDRRCVWKFCVIDMQGDLQSLSVQDQIAQRLMNKAREELRKSELNRKGLQVHKGLDYDGQPLTRGETFSRTLRAIILKKSHQQETSTMLPRRKKEEHIRDHFASLIYHEDGFDQSTSVADSAASGGEETDEYDVSVASPSQWRRASSQSKVGYASAETKPPARKASAFITSSNATEANTSRRESTRGAAGSGSGGGGGGVSSSASGTLLVPPHRIRRSSTIGDDESVGGSSIATVDASDRKRHVQAASRSSQIGTAHIRDGAFDSIASVASGGGGGGSADTMSMSSTGMTSARSNVSERTTRDGASSITAGRSTGSSDQATAYPPGIEPLDMRSSVGQRMLNIHRAMEILNVKASHSVVSKETGDGWSVSDSEKDTDAKVHSATTNHSRVLHCPKTGLPLDSPVYLKVVKMRQEDEMVDKAIAHRNRVNQYKKISDLFQDIVGL